MGMRAKLPVARIELESLAEGLREGYISPASAAKIIEKTLPLLFRARRPGKPPDARRTDGRFAEASPAVGP